MRLNKLLITLAVTLLGWPLSAPAASDETGMWTIFSTAGSLPSESDDGRWLYTFDAQARYLDFGSGINQWLVRPGIGYKFNNGVNAWVGYARLRARNGAGRVADENRYWQQLDWTAGNWAGGRVTMRTRLEQRNLDIGDDTGVVLRFMTKYIRPIGDTGNTSLIVGIEPFFDLVDTDWGGDSGLGQNRTYIGAGWRLGDSWSLEAGFMNQYVWRDSATNLSNHLAVFNFKLRL